MAPFPEEGSAYQISVNSERPHLTGEKDPQGVGAVKSESFLREKAANTWPIIRMDLLHQEHMAMLTMAGLEQSSWTREGGDITPKDTLLLVDMQNDFFSGKFAPGGGRAAVPEGESVIEPAVELIEAFSRCGALIVATRAFHPADHISFYEQGGPLPTHCVQATAGANFHPSVAEALQRAYTLPLGESGCTGLPGEMGKVEIAFKGFLNELASPGAFRYDRELFQQRLKRCRCDIDNKGLPRAMSAEMWTGAMALKCSNLTNDINAAPDVTALLQKDLRPLDNIVPKSGRLLIAGLALDNNVLDSAVAASRLGYESVFVAIDACRPTHFGMSGEYGSGFLTDPAFIVSELQKHKIHVIQSTEVLRTFRDSLMEGSNSSSRSNSPQKGGA